MIKRFTLFVILALPIAIISAQDIQTEKKIKIVIEDEKGNKTIIDTTFTGTPGSNAITLKNGKTIFIGNGEGLEHFNISEGDGHMTVTMTSDGKNDQKIEKTITITSSDSAEWVSSGQGGTKTYSFTPATGDPEKHVIIAHAGDENVEWESADGKQRVIVSVSKSAGTDHKEVMVHVPSVGNNDVDTNTNTTKMVVARDGMVITIEGEDEAKVKDLMKLIESNLGLDSKGPKGRK
jgi:hypothetical protein